MKGKTLKRSLSVVMTAAMVFGSASGVTAFAATEDGGSSEITLSNADMSFDIWGDDAGWKVEVDDWDATGASIKSFAYSSDEWMNAPSDGSDNGVNFWFGNGDGVLTLSQDVDLEAGDYALTAEAMGESADFYVSAAGADGEKTSLTGYNNWLTGSCDFTMDEDTESVSVKAVFDVSKDGWGYLNSVRLVKKGEGASDEDDNDDNENTGSGNSGSENADDVNDGETEWKTTTLVANGDFETGDASSWNVEMADADGDSVGTLVKTDQWATGNATSFFNYWNNGSESKAQIGRAHV